MNKLRTYLTPNQRSMVDCGEIDVVIDDYITGYRSNRRRKIFELEVSSCPRCGEHLKAYQNAATPEKSALNGEQAGCGSDSSTAVLEDRENALEIFEIFSSSPPFRDLSLADRQRIFAHGEIVEVDDGEAVIEEGKENLCLYVVLGGEFQVSLPAGPARYGEVVLASRDPPDCFGEYAFVDYKLASANVTAMRKSKLFKIQSDVLDRFIDADPELGRAIYENILLLVVKRLRDDDDEQDVFKPVLS